jgi:putative NADH-flavin reductase
VRIAVLGAGGGLGRNVVDAALSAKHDVVAVVRDPKRAKLSDHVTTNIVGDATHIDNVSRAMNDRCQCSGVRRRMCLSTLTSRSAMTAQARTMPR